jgi:hypothetical protein
MSWKNWLGPNDHSGPDTKLKILTGHDAVMAHEPLSRLLERSMEVRRL